MAQSIDNTLKNMGPIMFGGKDKVLEWFQGKGIVPATKLCERCPNSQQMVLTVKSDVADGYKFRCPACKTFKSVRGGRRSNWSTGLLPQLKDKSADLDDDDVDVVKAVASDQGCRGMWDQRGQCR
jgi:hypothetical protein